MLSVINILNLVMIVINIIGIFIMWLLQIEKIWYSIPIIGLLYTIIILIIYNVQINKLKNVNNNAAIKTTKEKEIDDIFTIILTPNIIMSLLTIIFIFNKYSTKLSV